MDLLTETDDEYATAERIGAQAGREKVPGVALGYGVFAIVNKGRWLIECPHCSSARMAHRDRMFWCPGCGNADVGGQSIVVEWPADWQTIEQLLAVRPVGNRNWLLRESVHDLARQNIDRGLPDFGVAATPRPGEGV